MKNEDKRPLLQQEHQLQSKSCNSLFEKEEGKSKKYSDEGLTVAKCAVFIVAQVAGSGILALPNAISGTGWIGVCVLTTMCIMALYCGVMLGQCWLLIRDKVDEEHVRNPYPLIGQFAAGSMGKYLVEFCVIAGLFGSSVVYLLLSSQQVSSLVTLEFGSAVDSWNPFHSSEGQFRMWVLICGSTLIPLTWFSSPKEMWLVPCFSSLCIIVASTIIVTRTSLSIMRYGVAAVSARKDITVKSFFKSFGTIAFSYGGAIVFPTFQADMNQPPKFIYSAFLGFLFVYLLYLPVSVLPYIAYGSNIQDNILETLNALPGTGKGLVIAGEILVTFHLLFGIIILNNPISQQIEHHLNTNQSKFSSPLTYFHEIRKIRC